MDMEPKQPWGRYFLTNEMIKDWPRSVTMQFLGEISVQTGKGQPPVQETKLKPEVADAAPSATLARESTLRERPWSEANFA